MKTISIKTEGKFLKSLAVAIFIFTAVTIYNNATINHRQQLEPDAGCSETIAPMIDWKRLDVTTLPPTKVMDYFRWTNASSCELAHAFGGIMMTREVVNRILGSGNVFEGRKIVPSGFDGQYSVCLDPFEIAPLPDHCLVYSFGINNEWSFDDAMALYGCQVYSFDPSMNQTAFNRSSNIHFYDLALADVDEEEPIKKRKLSTLYEMLKPIHGDVVIDYLKIDIEYNEWTVLPEIVGSGMLSKVRQLVLEVHLQPRVEDIKFYRDSVAVIKSLEDSGMIRFDSKYCPWCPAYFPTLDHEGYNCFQISWYNSRFLSDQQ